MTQTRTTNHHQPDLSSTADGSETGLRGAALLDDPTHNKGTAFTAEERQRYGLEGLLPASVENLDRQQRL
jgi:hypothetical protein